jgi:phosphoribosylformimino-5-aminoimidazole carboxamide ribotide isomerase
MEGSGLASAFDILPAIDLRGGRVVRLEEGDFARETAFSDDSVAVALGFVEAGATWLHIVDLDGARSGVPVHGAVIRRIIAAMGDRVRIEVAGGLRDRASVAEVLDAGADRVVVGTAALRDAAFAGRLVADHGAARIVVAIDVRGGRAVGQGWAADAVGVDPAEAVRRLHDAGVTTFEATAIERDGLQEGPDLTLYERLVVLDRGEIIASAGIATAEHLRAVRDVGCTGAILGRALYDGSLELPAALDAARSS